MKTTRRKYFTGTKKLKHVKMYEHFEGEGGRKVYDMQELYKMGKWIKEINNKLEILTDNQRGAWFEAMEGKHDENIVEIIDGCYSDDKLHYHQNGMTGGIDTYEFIENFEDIKKKAEDIFNRVSKLKESITERVINFGPKINKEKETVQYPNEHDAKKAIEILTKNKFKPEYVSIIGQYKDTLKFINSHEYKNAVKILNVTEDVKESIELNESTKAATIKLIEEIQMRSTRVKFMIDKKIIDAYGKILMNDLEKIEDIMYAEFKQKYKNLDWVKGEYEDLMTACKELIDNK